MPTRFSLEKGDMIVFKATGEYCVLLGQFDAVARRQKDLNEPDAYNSWPSYSWDIQWGRAWEEAGAWQERLSVPPEHIRLYGTSAVNLFNALSHGRAIKKGNIITMKAKA